MAKLFNQFSMCIIVFFLVGSLLSATEAVKDKGGGDGGGDVGPHDLDKVGHVEKTGLENIRHQQQRRHRKTEKDAHRQGKSKNLNVFHVLSDL